MRCTPLPRSRLTDVFTEVRFDNWRKWMSQKKIGLLVNDDARSHGKAFSRALAGAVELECVVAFAKRSGLDFILNKLERALKAGMKARFTIGLSLYLTEPPVLRKLLALSKHYALQLYVSDCAETFHPKIYALSRSGSCTVIIGSANLTGGGFALNKEASALIESQSFGLMNSVTKYIDGLVRRRKVVFADSEDIDKYEREYTIALAQRKLSEKRLERALKSTHAGSSTLGDILDAMKRDPSEKGFEHQKSRRSKDRQLALAEIKGIARIKQITRSKFLERYGELVENRFHSGGLPRGKTVIANRYKRFQAALADVLGSGKLSPVEAYQLLLEHLQRIPRAGVNVLTEILHAIDNKRFAVMNQNAVAGLTLASIHSFPTKPSKKNTSAEQYADFCKQCDLVRADLGLTNFTELDAVFNYAYWSNDDDGD
jgi:HKD family nuclease